MIQIEILLINLQIIQVSHKCSILGEGLAMNIQMRPDNYCLNKKFP